MNETVHGFALRCTERVRCLKRDLGRMLDSRQSRLNRCDKARSETGWCDGSTAHHINNNKSFNQLLWMTDGAIKYKSTNIACDWDFNGGILEQWNWPLGYENVAPQFLGCIKNFLLAPLCRSIKLCANYRTYLPAPSNGRRKYRYKSQETEPASVFYLHTRWELNLNWMMESKLVELICEWQQIGKHGDWD